MEWKVRLILEGKAILIFEGKVKLIPEGKTMFFSFDLSNELCKVNNLHINDNQANSIIIVITKKLFLNIIRIKIN